MSARKQNMRTQTGILALPCVALLALGAYAMDAGVSLGDDSDRVDTQPEESRRTPQDQGIAIKLAFQEEEGPRPPTVEDFTGTSGNDQQAELLELFKEVERSLQEIDDFLFEAAAAEEDLSIRESGLAELLDETDRASADTVDAIDRILEIAKDLSQQQNQQQNQQQQQQQQNQQQSEQDQQGDQNSPLNRPRSEQQQQNGEGQPEGPQPDLEGNSPQNRPDQNDGQSEGEGEGEQEQPGGDQSSEDAGQNQEGEAGLDATERAGAAASFGEWGELPPKVQEIFSNQRGESLPVEYRGWIDNYYRRLARGDR